jgi:glucosamine 6-phosphate synthetase-like amidotransferase/phosphosugar isomerase protein/DNA-directed RNA polymerase subunit RPC12/RpoP
MCGLVCVISKTPSKFMKQDVNLFTNLLIADTIRGKDSTGVFGITDKNNLDLLKAKQPGYTFTNQKEYKDFEEKALFRYKIMVGHNRSATKGNVTDENSHPFIKDHICLVHNGTLWNHRHLANVDVDSEAITHALVNKTPEELIPELDGAFALIWYNALEKKLYLTRNKERPLWIIQTPTMDVIGSEPGMLEWLYQRTYNKDIDAKYFETENLISYDCTNLSKEFEFTQLKKKPVILTKDTVQIYSTPSMSKTMTTQIICHGNYKYNDSITFKVESIIEHSKYNITINGILENEPNVKIKGFFSGTDTDVNKLKQSPYISGKLSGKHRTHENETTLYIFNPFPIKEIFDLKKKSHPYLNYKCSECDNVITLADTNKILISYKKNKTIHIKCPNCISKYPYLLKQQEQ